MSGDDVVKDDDERMDDVVASSLGKDGETEGSEDGEDSSDSEAEPVLAVTRERRANAGNRMSKLLELAELEDAAQEEEYGEIFAEVGDDVDFKAADDEEGDVNMDSSSEDEDAEAVTDEDAAEKELKRQERSENKKKRKRESLLQDAMKRAAARVGPKNVPAKPASISSPISGATRPRKKSERMSWLPEAPEGAVRASSRQLAVQNKSAVHQRLKEKEKHRLRTVAIMKAAERRKEAAKPKTLTQEERLEEAARTEQLNLKSLNRWEVAEKKRAEEQKARLAALKNHRLEGPIITYYSGPALWVNDRLKLVGKDALLPEDKQDTSRVPEVLEEDELHSPAPAVQPASSTSSILDQPLTIPIKHSAISLSTTAAPEQESSQPAQTDDAHGESMGFLHGIEAYAAGHDPAIQQPPEPPALPPTEPSTTDAQPLKMEQTPAQPPVSQDATPVPAPNQTPPTPAIDQDGTCDSNLASYQTSWQAVPAPTNRPQPPPPPPKPKEPPRREIAARVLVSLRDFPGENPNLSKRDPDFVRRHLLGWPVQHTAPTRKAEKTVTQQTVSNKQAACAVTGQPARYCDPATGLYYVDAVALKSMRWVINSKGKWSSVTNTFAHGEDKGARGRAARGVPDMFLMTGEQLDKRREQVHKLRAEEARIRAEQRAKAQAEAQARAEAQAKMQAQQAPMQPLPAYIQSGQQPLYRAYQQVPVAPQTATAPLAPVSASSSGPYGPPMAASQPAVPAQLSETQHRP